MKYIDSKIQHFINTESNPELKRRLQEIKTEINGSIHKFHLYFHRHKNTYYAAIPAGQGSVIIGYKGRK